MIEETERLLTDKDGDSLYARRAGNPNGMRVLFIDSNDGEVYVPTAAVDALEKEIKNPGYIDGLEAELTRLKAAVDSLVTSTTVADILERRLAGAPNVDPQYVADEITTALYRQIKGL